ncbi:N-acetylmuramoyl-L-alanine amidase [Thermocrinis albus DSM 14484]|uniref:N-acetylmuramoyl-L-alanine amidase n=1 Tax=Thermocrinis albus (strain DSM 14484 / JCM 11386 / HI 11/12) TaxID=638303 RepID=D3SNZ1_THEAH|nr:N-acetylmuramoyl-L-alanine amidase [Thermocrinis albus]ADC88878.1 N-acetylmuramoyl-L-alanine amidase [Thermocrinis albus DSM 14484]
MFRRSLATFSLLTLFSLLLGVCWARGEASIEVGFRRALYPDKERIVLVLGERVDYRVLLLENPKRIVVDIIGVSVKLPQGIATRVGKHQWGTRLVLERNYGTVKAFSLEDPFRIVLDIYAPSEKEKADDDSLIAILDPTVLKVLGYTHEHQKKERVISERVKTRVISQLKTVVIDPGHGGHDPGAIGVDGIKEKDVNLAIAKKLAKLLAEDGRFRVVMTRKDDTFVTLQERAHIALRNRADLLVSIHANASPKGVSEHARGTYIFAISSEAAQKKKEQIVRNDSYAKLALGVADLPISARKVLADLAMDVTLYESVAFAQKLAKAINTELGRNVEFKGVQRAGFAVLKTPGIPSVLVEVGFITNPTEARLMTQEDFQEKMAKAIYGAIVEYFFPSSQKVTSVQEAYEAEAKP